MTADSKVITGPSSTLLHDPERFLFRLYKKFGVETFAALMHRPDLSEIDRLKGQAARSMLRPRLGTNPTLGDLNASGEIEGPLVRREQPPTTNLPERRPPRSKREVGELDITDKQATGRLAKLLYKHDARSTEELFSIERLPKNDRLLARQFLRIIGLGSVGMDDLRGRAGQYLPAAPNPKQRPDIPSAIETGRV